MLILFIVFLNCFYFFTGIDREAADTGQLCLFVDNLFDNANGNVIKPTPGKDSTAVMQSH